MHGKEPLQPWVGIPAQIASYVTSDKLLYFSVLLICRNDKPYLTGLLWIFNCLLNLLFITYVSINSYIFVYVYLYIHLYPYSYFSIFLDDKGSILGFIIIIIVDNQHLL